MEIIDTHCHLPSLTHAPLDELLANAKAAGIGRMVCIGASDGLNGARDTIALADRYPHVFATVGVHPHDAGKWTDLEPLRDLLHHPKVVALGETGLDYFRDWAPVENQKRLFETTLAVAKEHKKPVVIHCRDAVDDTLATLERHDAREIGGVFHCFAGDAELAKRLEQIGFMVSIPGIVTFKSADKYREEIRQIPIRQIMLETDSPYMAPEPFRGKPCEPAYVRKVAEKIAEIKELTVEEVARITTDNAIRFFGLPS